MMTHHSRFGQYGLVSLLSLLMLLAGLTRVEAASLINPTAPPPGGQTAEPITASATEQHKLGSLVIGPSGGAAPNPTLCLNTDSIDDTGKCVSAWNDIGGLAATYVKVQKVTDVGYPLTQSGYVHLKGNNATTYPVTSRFGVYTGANPSGTYTALYADGLTLDNRAGYFVGTLGIEPTATAALGRLCLNGTGVSDCIYQWSDLVIPVTNKLTLQSLAAAPTSETGNVALSQAFNAASYVLGDPTGLSATQTCGDGMCNASETSGSCPIDCSTIKSLTGFSAVRSGSSVNLTLTTGATQAPSGSQVTVVVVRSTTSPISFKPMNGVTYTRGGTTSFAVVDSKTCTQAGGAACVVAMTDSSSIGLVAGKTYYYAAWQGNLYPRYQTAAMTASVTMP